ncbi:TIGR04222 domain-containing membrane protein [Nonomuraea mangrovi]|uniref:TIGR04222 domain-containing membrane protein n=1 Tax=Nonomuraea mangrovi TaxID=2316207 RepID=A0ABW4TBW1_9ACTN
MGEKLEPRHQEAIIDLVLLLLACCVMAVSLAGALRVRPARYPAHADVDRDRLAYLAGGRTRVINAALAELSARGTVTISATRRIQVSSSDPDARGPIETVLVEASRGSGDGLEVHLAHQVLTDDDVERIIGKGWVTERATERARRLLGVTAGAAALGLVGTLVLLGLRVVPAATLTFAAAGVFGLAAAGSMAGHWTAGRVSRLLREARLAHPQGERPARPSPEAVGRGVALHGLQELPDRRVRAALGHQPRPHPQPIRRTRRKTGRKRYGGGYHHTYDTGGGTGDGGGGWGWGDGGGGGGGGDGGGGGGGG